MKSLDSDFNLHDQKIVAILFRTDEGEFTVEVCFED